MRHVQLVCLAFSTKDGGYCVAGTELLTDRWIRPVTDSQHGELPYTRCLLTDNTPLDVLDVIEVPLAQARPKPHQPENWLIAPGPWRRITHLPRNASLELLSRISTSGPALFGDTQDRIPEGQFSVRPLRSSLTVVQPDDLAFAVTLKRGQFKQTRCMFHLSGQAYDLSLTHAAWRKRTQRLSIGQYTCEDLAIAPETRLFLTIGLAEPWYGYCFKLAVALICL